LKIEYVCHACLFVDTGDVKLVTDPWFLGPAYCGQWHVFPKPVNTEIVRNADVALFSHGHEDHLHEPSIRFLPRSAKAFYPYVWYKGTKPFLEELGFSEVVEAQAQRTYKLSPTTSVTYLMNSLDSIIVIESGSKVFVNINDALHAHAPKVQDIFIDYLNSRWERIDTVFCGFGGASYFPNTLHCPGKNDLEIGEAREQLFAHNFCRIVHALKPNIAVPFAADFVLLSPHQRWINDVRFPRTRMPEYFREIYGAEAAASIRIVPMYSGDVLDDNQLRPNSPYRNQIKERGLGHLIDEQYGEEIEALASQPAISEIEAQSLETEIIANINSRKSLFGNEVLRKIEFTIKALDCTTKPCFNVSLKGGETVLWRTEDPAKDSLMVLETFSRFLRCSFASDWGGDVIMLGYGCEIRVFNQETVLSRLDIVCVRLLTRHPSARRYWKKEPVRVAWSVLNSQTTRAWVSRAALSRSSDYSPGKTNDIMRECLFRSKCEVCRACDLPLLDEKFAATL
jgi:hypothetical protein